MQGAAIRDKLYDYIRVADEKKLKAIYSLLENEITQTTEWWKQVSFTKDLDQRIENWESGKEKAYTKDEVKLQLQQLKKDRANL